MTFHSGSMPVSVLVLAASLVSLCPQVACAEGGGDAGLVESACTAFEKNVAAIRTWTAEIEIEQKHTYGSLTNESTNAVTFAYDRKLPAWTFDWIVTKSLVTQDGKELPNYAGTETAELSIDSLLYTLRLDNPQAGSKPRIVTSLGIIDHPAGSQRVVPHQIFWFGGIDSFSEKQRRQLNCAQVGLFVTMTIKREADLVKVSYKSFNVKEEWVVDLAKAGSLVSYHQEFGQITHDWRVDVEEKNGVWVPMMIYHKYDETPAKGEKKDNVTRLTWKKNTVNEPLDPQTFTLTALRKGRPALLQDLKLQQTLLPAP